MALAAAATDVAPVVVLKERGRGRECVRLDATRLGEASEIHLNLFPAAKRSERKL